MASFQNNGPNNGDKVMYVIKLTSVYAIFFILTAYSDFDAPSDVLYKLRRLDRIESTGQLADSLSSESMPVRASAVLRLTELKDQSSIPALIKAYEREPYKPTGIIDGGPGVKYLILRGLGRIGGTESYNFLKRLSYELPSQYYQLLEKGNDPNYVYWGLLDALARLEPPDSAGIYYEMYTRNVLNHVVSQMAYETYERINLKSLGFNTFQDSLFYLLGKNRETIMKNIRDDAGHETPEFIKKNAIETLIITYATQNPQILEIYKSGLSTEDPFINEVTDIQKIVQSKMGNQQRGIQK